MKNILKYNLAFVAFAFFLTSCSGDDDVITNVSGTGNLGLEFDQSYGDNDLILGQANATSQGETLKISTVKYIVSNIVLTKADGTTFTYPKGQSYFIVDESKPDSHVIDLTDIPSGDYVKVKFGIGVDQQQYAMGAAGLGNFPAQAEAAGLWWGWSAGFIFVAFEGTFTSPTVTSDTSFKVHTGQTSTDYNYTEVTLDLPTKALVRQTITPDIHLIADVSKIIDGTNKIKLTDYNEMGMGAMIMGGAPLSLVTANLNGMFHVDHVHND